MPVCEAVPSGCSRGPHLNHSLPGQETLPVRSLPRVARGAKYAQKLNIPACFLLSSGLPSSEFEKK